MIVLDTHTLIWWVNDSSRLSTKALNIINREKKDGQILVSSMSVWEVYLLVKKGKLILTVDTESWFKRIENLPFVQFMPVDNMIAAKSVNLPGEFHEDPADRIIVATAKETGAILVTIDEKIRKYKYVKSVW